MKLLKDVAPNSSIGDLLCGVPKYEKFIRSLLRTEGGEKFNEVVAVSKTCSSVIRRELVTVEKERDPGVPTIPIIIGHRIFAKALCDLGSGVSLMPLSVARILNLEYKLKYTPIAFLLTNKSIVLSDGIIEDVLVHVDSFLVPVHFIVMDIEENKEVPLILGRTFLATDDAEIRVKDNMVTFRVNGETVCFNAEKAKKPPWDLKNKGCYRVDMLDISDQIVEQDYLGENPIELGEGIEQVLSLENKGSVYDACLA